MLDISEWHYRCLKGRIASHVASGTDSQKAIIRSAETMLAKGEIGPEVLRRMLGVGLPVERNLLPVPPTAPMAKTIAFNNG